MACVSLGGQMRGTRHCATNSIWYGDAAEAGRGIDHKNVIKVLRRMHLDQRDGSRALLVPVAGIHATSERMLHLAGGSCRSQIGLVRCNPLWHHSRAAIDGKMLEKFATLRITGQIPQSAGSLGGGLLHFCGGRRPSTSAELLITLPRGTGCGANSAGGGRLLGFGEAPANGRGAWCDISATVWLDQTAASRQRLFGSLWFLKRKGGFGLLTFRPIRPVVEIQGENE